MDDKDRPENGLVRTTEFGTPCADGGEDSYRHYFAESPLSTFVGPNSSMVTTAPAFGNLPGTLRATFDVHYVPGTGNAFLLGQESHATIANERGSIQFTLQAGDCDNRPVQFDGTTASTTDQAWSAVSGTGSYAGITGGGTYGFSAEMNPGADNEWSIDLDGNLQVLQPSPHVMVEETYWGSLGLDYVDRVLTVVYRIGNTGDGDGFAARFESVDKNGFDTVLTSPGVTVCGGPRDVLVACPKGPPPPEFLGDLDACADDDLPATCDTDLLVVRYRLDPATGPCTAVILNCTFETTLTVGMSDALDLALQGDHKKANTVTVTAPALPPPL